MNSLTWCVVRLVLAVAVISLVSVHAFPLQALKEGVVVTGSVRVTGTSEGIGQAQVRLAFEESDVSVDITETAADGRFEFRGVGPGRYFVQARRQDYYDAPAHGTASTVASSTPFTVSGQGISNVAVNLSPGGSISGRILNMDGSPAAHVRVIPLRLIYRSGIRYLSQSGNGQLVDTNDAGEYRLFGLSGPYFIVADPLAGRSPAGNSSDVTYYPGTHDSTRAVPVSVGPGAGLIGFNFQLQRASTATIRGTVVDAAGTPVRMPSFRLLPMDPPRYMPVSVFSRMFPDNVGAFEIRGVEPGVYELFTRESGKTTIRVEGADIEGVKLVVGAAVDVRAHVSFAGEVAIDPTSIELRLDERDKVFDNTLVSTRRPDSSGNAVFNPMILPMSVNILSARFANPDAYIADIRQDAVSIFDAGRIELKTRPVSLEVIVRADGGRIEGTVRGAPAGKIRNARVILAPQLPQSNPALFQGADPDSEGRFTFRGVAPGNYKVFAFEYAPAGAWENAEFMGQADSLGQAVSVQRGKSETLTVNWIPDMGGHP